MALVVVHNRRIVAARYAHGANKDTRLESWSMGKSIAGTWIGMLIRQGVLKLEDRAPFSRGGRRRVAGGSGGPQACAGAPRGSRTRAHALVQILACAELLPKESTDFREEQLRCGIHRDVPLPGHHRDATVRQGSGEHVGRLTKDRWTVAA